MKAENKKYIIEQELVGIRLDKAVTILDKEISRMMSRQAIRRRKYKSKSVKKKKLHIRCS